MKHLFHEISDLLVTPLRKNIDARIATHPDKEIENIPQFSMQHHLNSR